MVAGMTAIIAAMAAPARAARKVVERIIARVNSEIITQRQYERERDKLRQDLSRQFAGAELDAKVKEFSKDLLRDLIDQALMVQKAKDLDVNVETDVVKRLDEIRQSFNLGSLEDLQKEVEKQGILWEDFKENIRRNLLMREVIGREVGRTIIISREDARKYFGEHKQEFASPGGVSLAQILISNEKHKPEEAEKRAKDALAELKAGQKWSDVVSRYSDDPATANDGGSIGFMKDGTLAPAVSASIAKLDTNEFSDLIPIQTGFIILRVLDRRHPGIPPFEEVEQRVQEVLYNRQMQPALRKYLVDLRRDSYVYLAPGYVDSGAERPSETVLAKKGQ
ncbi:MAG: peptidyl-prolyl cis-trans isomerase [Acidobacteriia bacterium]|nr:peptidyl-prolyl cis-trans isomerase [Terriglobia bacterium]